MLLISIWMLVTGLPLRLLPNTQSWSSGDLPALLALVVCLIAVMVPLDLFGGFLLPNRSRPNTITFGAFVKGWLRGVVVQSFLFFLTSLLILTMGRWIGWPGAVLAVLSIAVFLVAFQL